MGIEKPKRLDPEQEKQNVLDGIEDAREFWMEAPDPVERERQMKALDSLFDVAIKAGYFAVKSAH